MARWKVQEFGGKQLKGWDAVRISDAIPAGTDVHRVKHGGMTEKVPYHPEWHKYEGKWNEWDVWVGPVPKPFLRNGHKGPKYYKTRNPARH